MRNTHRLRYEIEREQSSLGTFWLVYDNKTNDLVKRSYSLEEAISCIAELEASDYEQELLIELEHIYKDIAE